MGNISLNKFDQETTLLQCLLHYKEQQGSDGILERQSELDNQKSKSIWSYSYHLSFFVNEDSKVTGDDKKKKQHTTQTWGKDSWEVILRNPSVGIAAFREEEATRLCERITAILDMSLGGGKRGKLQVDGLLRLLRVLHLVHRHGWILLQPGERAQLLHSAQHYRQGQLPAFSHGMSWDEVEVGPVLCHADGFLSPKAFHNPIVQHSFTVQLGDCLAVAGEVLPEWLEETITKWPFLLPAALRRRYFQCTAFSPLDGLLALQDWAEKGHLGLGSVGERKLEKPRTKVKVAREKILKSAIALFDRHASASTSLEFEFDGECGSGLGPTLEFYTLVCQALLRRGHGLWLQETIEMDPDRLQTTISSSNNALNFDDSSLDRSRKFGVYRGEKDENSYSFRSFQEDKGYDKDPFLAGFMQNDSNDIFGGQFSDGNKEDKETEAEDDKDDNHENMVQDMVECERQLSNASGLGKLIELQDKDVKMRHAPSLDSISIVGSVDTVPLDTPFPNVRNSVGGAEPKAAFFGETKGEDIHTQISQLKSEKSPGDRVLDKSGTKLKPISQRDNSRKLKLNSIDSSYTSWERARATPQKSSKEHKELYISCPQGVFPAPLPLDDSPAKRARAQKATKAFRFFGMLVAKALVDKRLLAIPISRPLLKLVKGERLSPWDLWDIDPSLAFQLEKLTKVALQAQTVDRDPELSPKEKKMIKQNLEFDGATIEELCLTFVLPGFPDIELHPGGAEINVNINNLSDYIKRVACVYLESGIKLQVHAMLDGFDQIFKHERLRPFSIKELEVMVCGEPEEWTVEYLQQVTVCDHGYEMDSEIITHLFEVLCGFDADWKRLFIQFLTGAPQLSVGGMQKLNPRFTVVRKDPEQWSDLPADMYLPSVMTCAHYLKLPKYSSKEILEDRLRKAIVEGQSAFHLS